MAVIDKNGVVRGSAGNMVYRRVGSKNVIQAKPEAVEQSEATKKCGIEFGLASTTAKSIRIVMNGIYSADGGMVNRLTNVVKSAIVACRDKGITCRDLHDADLSRLTGFQFNEVSALSRVLKVRPSAVYEATSGLTVSLPSFDGTSELLYPKSSLNVGCTLTVTLTAFNFRGDYYMPAGQRSTDLEAGQNAALEWNFPVTTPAGCILLAVMSLHYFVEDDMSGRRNINSSECSPAEIIGAFLTGESAQGDEPQDTTGREGLPGYLGNALLRNYEMSC